MGLDRPDTSSQISGVILRNRDLTWRVGLFKQEIESSDLILGFISNDYWVYSRGIESSDLILGFISNDYWVYSRGIESSDLILGFISNDY